MSSITYSYLGVVIAILCFLVPTYELWFNKERKGISRITKAGWILFFISVLVAWVSIGNIKATNNEKAVSDHAADSTRKADKEDIIKSVQEALKEHNLKYDTVKREILYINKDSINYYGVPNISINGLEGFKAVYNKTLDTIKFVLYLWNFSNTDAYNFKFKIHVLGEYSGHYHSFSYPYVIDSNTIINANSGFVYKPVASTIGFPRFDSLYFYIDAHYTNYYKRVRKDYKEWIAYDFESNAWGIAAPSEKQRLFEIIKPFY